MSRIDAWQGNSFPLAAWVDDADLGVDTAKIISDKPTSIVVVRAGSSLSAQTIRLEPLRGETAILTTAGDVRRATMLVIGYKGHPTITDTNLQAGDRFAVAGRLYEVIAVAPGLTDSLQAHCEAKA